MNEGDGSAYAEAPLNSMLLLLLLMFL